MWVQEKSFTFQRDIKQLAKGDRFSYEVIDDTKEATEPYKKVLG